MGVFVVLGESSWDTGAPISHPMASHLKMIYLLHLRALDLYLWNCSVVVFPASSALRHINAIIRIAMAPRPYSYLHCPLANPRWALGGCVSSHFIPILPSTLEIFMWFDSFRLPFLSFVIPFFIHCVVRSCECDLTRNLSCNRLTQLNLP